MRVRKRWCMWQKIIERKCLFLLVLIAIGQISYGMERKHDASISIASVPDDQFESKEYSRPLPDKKNPPKKQRRISSDAPKNVAPSQQARVRLTRFYRFTGGSDK